jgi:hypothetical protein
MLEHDADALAAPERHPDAAARPRQRLLAVPHVIEAVGEWDRHGDANEFRSGCHRVVEDYVIEFSRSAQVL